jgi:hypothetical protein
LFSWRVIEEYAAAIFCSMMLMVIVADIAEIGALPGAHNLFEVNVNTS